MTCAYCKKETSDILRKCQNCGHDLEEYNSNREKALEGTGFTSIGNGFSIEESILKLGPIGGIIIMIISIVWFFSGLYGGTIFFYPPILFTIGIAGTISGFVIMKKRKELKKKKESGEIID